MKGRRGISSLGAAGPLLIALRPRIPFAAWDRAVTVATATTVKKHPNKLNARLRRMVSPSLRGDWPRHPSRSPRAPARHGALREEDRLPLYRLDEETNEMDPHGVESKLRSA
jgi:hypothetical protein